MPAGAISVSSSKAMWKNSPGRGHNMRKDVESPGKRICGGSGVEGGEPRKKKVAKEFGLYSNGTKKLRIDDVTF